MTWPVPYSFGSALSLLGAFGIGWALHRLLQGTWGLGSPLAIGGVVVGGVLLVVGARWNGRFDPSQLVHGQPEDRQSEFDATLSPLRESPDGDEDRTH